MYLEEKEMVSVHEKEKECQQEQMGNWGKEGAVKARSEFHLKRTQVSIRTGVPTGLRMCKASPSLPNPPAV